jgi:hypothetical protein
MTDKTVPVVAFVTFPLTSDSDNPAFRKILAEAGPEYTHIPGLRRKYFLSGDGLAGGVYEWDSRARAAAFFDTQWYEQMAARYGARPEVRLFDAPAIADGVRHELEMFLPEA